MHHVTSFPIIHSALIHRNPWPQPTNESLLPAPLLAAQTVSCCLLSSWCLCCQSWLIRCHLHVIYTNSIYPIRSHNESSITQQFPDVTIVLSHGAVQYAGNLKVTLWKRFLVNFSSSHLTVLFFEPTFATYALLPVCLSNCLFENFRMDNDSYLEKYIKTHRDE